MDITAEGLLAMYDQSVRQIGSRDGICRFLEILSRNPELDFMDAVSLYTLYPDGKMLNTYRGWDKEYGRHIKRWEKGIKVIEYTQEDEVDEDGEVYMHPVPKLVSKYDISQTQGKAVSLFACAGAIRNMQCQKEFRKIVSGIMTEKQKKMGIPVNSLSGICAAYVLCRFYGVENKDLEMHLCRYVFDREESIQYFLGELFEILGDACRELNSCYGNSLKSFMAAPPDEEAAGLPEPEPVFCPKKPLEPSEKVSKPLPDAKDADVKTALVQPVISKEPVQTKPPVQQPKKTAGKRKKNAAKNKAAYDVSVAKPSLLRKLRLKAAEAKIYNSENN